MAFSEDNFVNLIYRIAKDKKLLKEFLKDILSRKEYKNLLLRWRIIEMLTEGKSQREIAELLRVSVTTVSRGANVLKNASGGFAHVLTYELSKRSK